MLRLFQSAAVGLALLTTEVAYPAGGDKGVKLDVDSKTDLGLVVTLRLPRDMRFADAQKIMERVTARGATKWSMRVAEVGDGLSAEVTVRPPMLSKRVASVVEKLLDSGFKKISIEVKK